MKLLVLTSRFPYPIEKGDKLRAYHQIRELSRDHTITLVSLSEHPVAAADMEAVKQWCHQVHVFPLRKWGLILELLRSLLDGRPAQVAYFFRRSILRKVKQLIVDEKPDHVYCQLLRMAAYARDISCPATLDYMDTFSVGMARRSRESRGWRKLVFAWEARRVARYEDAIFPDFQHHTIISVQDRDHLPLSDPQRVVVIPNGIDLTFFQHPSSLPDPDHDLVFVGNMGYFPNVRAARYLVEEVMPLVWQDRPETTLLLAGARPSPEVKKLAQDSRITVSGWVEDIRNAYLGGRMLVAPLFTGSGQQNKILEAMALGRPCITTPMVNNAIGANPGEGILLAADAVEFSEQIHMLLENPDQQVRIGHYGMAYIQATYSWSQATVQLSRLMEGRSAKAME